MPYVKNNSYRAMPFSSETAKSEFYSYSSLADLATRSELNKEDIYRCRTVGILHSQHGKFYLTEVDSPVIKADEPVIRVSMVYLASPPPSPVIPYPVQVFGTLQWKNRPVIFAMILQVLSAPLAIRLRAAMSAVTSAHLPRSIEDSRHANDPT